MVKSIFALKNEISTCEKNMQQTLSQGASLVGGEKFCILLFLQQFIDNFPLRSETMSNVTNCYCIYVFWLFHQSLA